MSISLVAASEPAEDASVSIEPTLKMVVVGHVDHGKSTLIGRLLHDTGSLPDGKLEELKAVSAKRGMPLEWSFVLDAFQAERDQAVTIDTTQIWFKTKRRDVVIIDAPGHREFLKNMVSGAALADAAILVVDAAEGVREQTKRHAYLLNLLGLRQVIVVVNKMDLVGWSAERFETVKAEVAAYLNGLGLVANHIIPISARDGANLASLADGDAPWFGGPCVVDALDEFRTRGIATDLPLRFVVQDVYKFDERRIVAGRVESGTLHVGDELIVSPSGLKGRVKTIEHWGPGTAPVKVLAGDVAGITFEEQIFVERGDILSLASTEDTQAPMLSMVFRGRLFWLSNTPLAAGNTYTLRLATRQAKVTVQAVETVIDTGTLERTPGRAVTRNEVAEVILRADRMLAVDEYRLNPAIGRFALVDAYDTVAGGTISMDGYADQRHADVVKRANIYEVDHLLDRTKRAQRNGHKGQVVWLTGLSGAGKSTLAMRVEQRLFDQGFQTYVLDGDNVRAGLNADLGFSPEDRAENIRRVGAVAGLFADAGMIVLTAFISPYQADRHRAREAMAKLMGDGAFHEVYVKADLETCESRDPKGLYKRARAGQIKEFTGISSPYEAPHDPQMVIDTSAKDIEACVDELVAYVLSHARG